MSLTSFGEISFLGGLFGLLPYPDSLHILGLFLALTADGSEYVEVPFADTGYARIFVVSTVWGTPYYDETLATYAISNKQPIVFPEAEADWGTITHYGFFDSNSTLVLWGQLQLPKYIQAGRIAKFAIDELRVYAE